LYNFPVLAYIILTTLVILKNGSTALIEAASEGYHEIVNYLINNGAKVDQTDKVSALND